MNARFQPANFFAILIAIILMVIGFALYFINEQNTAAEEDSAPPTAPEDVPASGGPETGDALARAALIQAIPGVNSTSGTNTGMDLLRQTIGMAGALMQRPVPTKTGDCDVYIDVSKESLTCFFKQVGYTGEKFDSGETKAIPPLLVVSINQGWAGDNSAQFKNGLFTGLC